MIKIINYFLLSIFMFVFYSLELIAQDKQIYIRSNAYDYSSGKFLYSENHYENYKNGSHIFSIVRYKDSSEKEFAMKKIEFGSKRTQPDFKLEDYRTGYFDKSILIHPDNQVFSVEHRRSNKHEIKSKFFQVPGKVVIDGGFDYFIRDNFDSLIEGKVMKSNFILANRQDYFLCRVQKRKYLKYNDRDSVQFELTPENFIIRQIADKLIVTYDKKSGRLLEYIGVSNLQNDEADDFPKVKIIFQYNEGQLDRL